MPHVYLNLNRLITEEEINERLDKQIRERDKKEFIDKVKQKILSIFRKKAE